MQRRGMLPRRRVREHYRKHLFSACPTTVLPSLLLLVLTAISSVPMVSTRVAMT